MAKTEDSKSRGALDHVRGYIARGWWVFPVPPGTKQSYLSKDYNGQRWGATNELARAEEYWEWRPEANVGLPTGELSGFFIVEADTLAGHSVDGVAALERLQAKYGRLPDTLMAMSPSGSVHRYFNWPSLAPGFVIKNSTSRIAEGVDVLGEGGMVLAPPSVKPGAGAYRWLNERTPLADAPSWLLDMTVAAGPASRPTRPAATAPVDIDMLACALEAIPNPDDLGWVKWNRVGLAIWAVTGDSYEGFALFDRWSEKWPRYDFWDTEMRWDKICGCPPNRTGAGKIFAMADKARPGWFSEYLHDRVPRIDATERTWRILTSALFAIRTAAIMRAVARAFMLIAEQVVAGRLDAERMRYRVIEATGAVKDVEKVNRLFNWALREAFNKTRKPPRDERAAGETIADLVAEVLTRAKVKFSIDVESDHEYS